MSNSAKKLEEGVSVQPETSTQSDLTNERELKLANNFEDPALEHMIPALGGEEPSGPAALVHETADALTELVNEAAGPEADALQIFGMDLDSAGEEIPPVMSELAPEGHSPDLTARWEIAERLFELVACEQPFDKVVDSLLAILIEGVQAEAGSVLELDFEKDEFFFRSSLGGGDPAHLKAFRVPKTQGIVGQVANSRRFVRLADLDEDQSQLRAISMSTGFEARTCLAGPIIVAGQLYGVVEVFNRKSGDSFSEADLKFLEEIVKMMSKVLEVRFLTAALARRAG